jgi:tetratricopeptide (TPR) repeat protein
MTYSEKMLDQLSSGQLDDAKKSFASALRHDDDDMLYSLAEELYGLGFVRQAQRTYLKLLERYPDEDQLRTALADIAIDEGNNDEALSYLDQIKPESNAYVQSLLVAADLYQTQELFEVSEQKLIEAYNQAPEEPVVLFALAEFYYMMGQYETAIPYYFSLIEQGETNFAQVDLAGRLGISYAQSGKFETAIGYLKQVKPEFQSSDIRFQTGFTQLQLKQYEAAIEVFKDLQEQDPQYATVYPYLAQAYEKLERYSEALTALQEGLGVDQYNEQLYQQAAAVASHLDDEDLMERYLSKAHGLDPENIAITIEYSNLLLKRRKYAQNIELLLPAVKSDQTDPQIYWNLAVSYQDQDQYDQAQKYYDAALPYFNDQPEFVKQTVYFYREMGQRETMLEQLKKYVQLVPDDSEMALLLEETEDEF